MAEAVSNMKTFRMGKNQGDIILSLAVVSILMMMILPLPKGVVDLLLATSFSLSLVVLFVSLQTRRPVEFSTFPSILLMVTLFRLALNIAATRLILFHGHEGPEAAGQVVKSFGQVVVGGNYTVGIIIFAILVVINFVVITKGAGRIAEVAARFMLDAMPGKQISTDADLSAGLISEREARKRRAAISREADFYGAMDGASKFVRGDAIAAVLMILINIVGGLVIGVFQKGMGLQAAAQNYTLLTIGEGLAAQIPALIVSTAAGIVVTRAASESSLGVEVVRQVMVHPSAIYGAAAIVAVLGLMPGLPHSALLTLAFLLAFLGIFASRHMGGVVEESVEPGVARSGGGEQAAGGGDEGGGEVSGGGLSEGEKSVVKEVVIVPADLVQLDVGYGLIPLVDEAQGGDLARRITAIRKQLSLELGFPVPPVHIKDNLSLKPNEYLILIKGTEVSRGDLLPKHLLAMNAAGGGDKGIPGVPTKEPCFGIPALWIAEGDRDRAVLAGLTVIDLGSVITTHLTEMIRKHAYELLGRQEAQTLLDQFKKQGPKVVEELVPNLLPLGGVAKVLSNLLRERVPIKDLRTILETLADMSSTTKDTDQLTEYVRQAMARTITGLYQAPDRSLQVMNIDPHLDQQIAGAIQQTTQGAYLALDPTLAQKMLTQMKVASERLAAMGNLPVVLCSPTIRPHLQRLVERFLPSVAVLSSNEVAPQVKLHSLEIIKVAEAEAAV